MKLMRKSHINMAVAAGLIGLASGPGVVSAAGTDTNTGQALVMPYYTVNDGWTTTFNVMNTSDTTLAVKVRFHESKNSRDVLDFNIVMSPYDAWTGWIEDSETGPQLFTTDKSCTSPSRAVVNGATASNIAYTGAYEDLGGNGANRMREGYVELLVMGIAPAGWEDAAVAGVPTYPTAYYAKHDANGEPRDCAKVDQAFLANAPTWESSLDPAVMVAPAKICTNGNPEPLPGSGSPKAGCDFLAPTPTDLPLKGNVAWLHALTGTGAGSEAIAVGNWSDKNYVTAQVFPWFLEPTFASRDGLWTVTGVTAFEAAISYSATLNEWADNPANGAATDWIVTFPTKAYHVDKFNDQIQAAVSKYRFALADVVTCTNDSSIARNSCVDTGNPVPVAPFESLFAVGNSGIGTGDSKVSVDYFLLDREEGGVALGSTSISPAPPGEIASLRFEANVLQFGTEPVVDANNPVLIDASAQLDGAVNGWAEVRFKNGALPVVAFAIKERDRGEAGTAYGQAMDNGYKK